MHDVVSLNKYVISPLLYSGKASTIVIVVNNWSCMGNMHGWAGKTGAPLTRERSHQFWFFCSILFIAMEPVCDRRTDGRAG